MTEMLFTKQEPNSRSKTNKKKKQKNKTKTFFYKKDLKKKNVINRFNFYYENKNESMKANRVQASYTHS